MERTCSKCKVTMPMTMFHQHKPSPGGRKSMCKFCYQGRYRATLKSGMQRYLSIPKKRLLHSSKSNACTNGIEHTITVDDIPMPVICKYLGIKLDYRRASERGRLRSWNAPSIDRIDPTKGYIPGNIQVVSDLANRMKQDATIKQLLAFAEGIIRVHG